ncbi:hypothetical protein DWU98_20265 [Dyella monticola]|uniref:Uncharacterized protein n=1 Tax=Dyella monticola TaxID=1927958 RepID=A0A370WS61_9GAMM|nr:hypothetical protein [Dyella monticola]RDS78954.1 hypothetical protein DWU98_20265 [Dyella monticola]
MSDDRHESDSHLRSELHIAQVVHAAISKGYQLALVVAMTATYAADILKQKLPAARSHRNVSLAAPRNRRSRGATFSEWVPDKALEGLAKTGEAGGYYFAEYFYSMSPASHRWDSFFDTAEDVADDFMTTRDTQLQVERELF